MNLIEIIVRMASKERKQMQGKQKKKKKSKSSDKSLNSRIKIQSLSNKNFTIVISTLVIVSLGTLIKSGFYMVMYFKVDSVTNIMTHSTYLMESFVKGKKAL